MDKYIIVTLQDFLDWNSDKVKNHLFKVYDSTEKAAILRFSTIPALFSSKTVYTKDEVEAMV